MKPTDHSLTVSPIRKGERPMHNIPSRDTRAARSRSPRWCLLAVAVSVWVVGWIAVTAQGTPATAFVHVNVIDGTGAPLKTDQTVVVANGRIVSIGRAADVPLSDAARQSTALESI
jgi:hypothetical protein